MVEKNINSSEPKPKEFCNDPANIMLRNAIEETIERENISIRKLAKSIGMDNNYLGQMKSGRSKISINNVPLLCRRFGMDRYAFLQLIMEQRYPEFIGFFD